MKKQLLVLLKKDLRLEWRTQQTLHESFLHLGVIIFICYFCFNLYTVKIQLITWNIILWLILLFSATTITNKTFKAEYGRRRLFYYALVNPQALILSKIILNSLFLTAFFSLTVGLYSLVMGTYVVQWTTFLGFVSLASLAFSSILTLVSAISNQTSNPATLTVILGFPLLIPTLLTSLKVSKYLLDDLDFRFIYPELILLLALSVIAISLSLFFFPYIWQK